MKLFLKGDRCQTEKCAFERRAYPPGQHGQRRTKLSDYGLQLREKQKAKRIYGVLERQFRRYYDMANRTKGATGMNLLRILETRLDNVIYRCGLADSRKEARQLVLHVSHRLARVATDCMSPEYDLSEHGCFHDTVDKNTGVLAVRATAAGIQ